MKIHGSHIKLGMFFFIGALCAMTTACSSGGGGAFVLGSSTGPGTTTLTASPTPTPGGSPSASASPSPSPSPSPTYQSTVMGDNPTYYWQLNETSGTTFKDVIANNTGTEAGVSSTFTLGIGGPIINTSTPSTGVAFNGGSYIYTADLVQGPNTFSVEFWFQTNMVGGRFVGFGNAQTGTSTDYDRQFYMDGAGDLALGVDMGGGVNGIDAIGSNGVNYADSKWHYAVGTCCGGNNGFHLYIDGNLVASGNAAAAQNYQGYWRFGYDNLLNWPGAVSEAYLGNLSEIAVYGTILTSTQIANHFKMAQ